MCLKIALWMADNVDLDEMQHSYTVSLKKNKWEDVEAYNSTNEKYKLLEDVVGGKKMETSIKEQ